MLRQKIYSREAARREFGPDREFRLVFTNGCFDVLHRGHVELLARARDLGDRLLVGLNGDDSVRRLKGPGRPLQSEDDRAACLAGLHAVDAVVVFDEDTPAELIAELQPDVLVKGGDYAPDQIVGRQTVEERGGRLVIIPYIEGISTSALIERMARASESGS
ncbi:MAG: D-glycero-beta-D-manno-heptose 1-phosphate adenylyltransferase [Gemmatimonadetes bacterium]|uniref:D-glycero-beta-D-manno-heptose 1-phosphate adenylyltransferase n=1 Tax=Candidatus Kutchimonas denitrificans TaxID=3056748 RepID=A0AAE4Z8F7_9BACT|nr:D-glycero-beta-D-manno-heptose 1-phosphate adenylyltransferase [Gemmatimonadota bacterium]NIR75740.1 D-glycero-beta-D-manno-heptose 1-phosphate adenylyltransferase [Candidatus Kutchimonas denitrificans]NIS00353.1 D-glycero-beta-D-manno-heptose 1-phosphate adenylyltransferase [Gemmatimonadota bacterium]NIT66012.1 D-glycero-beta-D-manno-heptose 1-phosphate adenylyltransferase [Gemmatimonadota bacterium]NIU53716.1 D-glycero-beta-D-manno-heptose 1-phosphate adenylyltransferase [Gemmatimonadota b